MHIHCWDCERDAWLVGEFHCLVGVAVEVADDAIRRHPAGKAL